MRLSLYRFEHGVETIGGNRVVYDLEAGSARFGAATPNGRSLVWQLDHDARDAEDALLSRFVQLDPFADWVVRCDRVDFPLGGIAYPTRILARGSATCSRASSRSSPRAGRRSTGRAALGSSGPDPVTARASAHIETSFVRVLVLPAEWAGKRTIRYLEPPPETTRPQRASVLLEHAIALPR